jgi:hypothetical protein
VHSRLATGASKNSLRKNKEKDPEKASNIL